MHILDTIVQQKLLEIAEAKEKLPYGKLEESLLYPKPPISMKESILDPLKCGIITEFKRKSPSRPTINLRAKIEKIVPGYQAAGSSAISVLTDTHFFGGSNHDLVQARPLVTLPIIRKEFILDPYQVLEAKHIGADAILLIARILTKKQLKELTRLAKSIGLEVLIEIHNQAELDKITDMPDMIGINNRNLETFEVDYENSIKLIDLLPADVCKIAESGIHSSQILHYLRQAGFDGFLIGELFMTEIDPGRACQKFIENYRCNH